MCSWLFQLVIVSFDDTIYWLLLKKYHHLGGALCIGRAMQLSDDNYCQCHLVSQSSVIDVPSTVWVMSNSRHRKQGGMWRNSISCEDTVLSQC